jgi:isorenieratene synthase
MRGWSPALRAFFIGLARNGLSAQPNEIPLSGFIAFLRFYTLLRRDAWAFSYLPDDGGTSLVDPLVRSVQALGGTIALGTRVTHLEQAAEGWVVHWAQDQAHGQVRAEQAILATDAPATAQILHDSPDLTTRAEGLYWPRGLGTAVVRLWFGRAPHMGPEAGVFSGDWTPDNFFWLHRIQDPYVRWHRATGGSALEAHIYGPPELLAEPDRQLLLRTITDVEFAFPELRGHRIQQAIRRNPPAHTLFGLGPADRHLGTITPWPRLYCCGDWVRHPSPAFFMERACVTGIAAANAVLESHGLPAWPLLEGLQPESLAGGIERLMHIGRRILRRNKGP